MTKEKEELIEEAKFKVGEIKRHVANLLIYMNDERKNYENVLEYDPEIAKDHIWLDIKAIADCIGITPDDTWKQYGHVFDRYGIHKTRVEVVRSEIDHSQYERMRVIIDVIKRLCGESSDGNVARSDIVSEAEVQGMESSKAESALDRLNHYGQIYEPIHGKYRLGE